jgi:hypothetical protein
MKREATKFSVMAFIKKISVMGLPREIFVDVPIDQRSYEHTNDEEKGLEKTCKRAILQQQREGGEHHQRNLHRNSSAEEEKRNN